MLNSIKDKKSFTLIELLIVLLIIFSTYYLVFSQNSFKVNEVTKNIQLNNLQSFLLKNFSFEKELLFFCVENSFDCFVKIDNEIVGDFKIEGFFKEKPAVYAYNKNQISLEFEKQRVNNEDLEVVFELQINNDFKIKEFILENFNKGVYVFNSIYKKPLFLENLSKAFEGFILNEVEVRDAF